MVAKMLGLAAIMILLSAVIVMSLSENQIAEAKSQKMSPKHKYSKWTKHVCGEDLCTDSKFLKTKQHIGKSKSR